MKLRIIFIGLFTFAIGILGLSSVNAQVSGTRATTRQIQRLVVKIGTKIDVLKDEADRVAERRAADPAISTDLLGNSLTRLQEITGRLDDAIDARRAVDQELTEVLTEATTVDQFMTANRVSVAAQSQWRSLKTDLNLLARYNGISWNWNQPIRGNPSDPRIRPDLPAYTATDTQMQTLLSRIELKTDIYKRQMDTAVNSSTSATVDTRTLVNYIEGFESATDRLNQRFASRQTVADDASDVLLRAAYIDQFMTRNRFNAQAQAQWRNLRADLNTLATYYRVAWNWNQTLPPYPSRETGGGTGRRGNRGFDASLTGTYRLNQSASEDVTSVIDRTFGSYSVTERENLRRGLERRLQSPEMIAIEKNGPTVGMASSILPQVSFQADGVAKAETNARGRTITTTATADQDGLIINYQGERSSDFYVTFAPMADGRLKVTRRVYLDNGSDSITVSSTYDKIDNQARWNMVTTGNTVAGGNIVVNESFIIPAGSRLNAVLRDPIDTSGARISDRFTMEVTGPTRYRGAIISGRVVTEDNASRVAGRSRVLLNFDTIRMSDGQTYRFTGNIETVIADNGDNIVVNNQATVRTTSSSRSGAGSVLGALLGALGGQPIDQPTNTGGTILTQNRDAMDLGAGSQFVITATASATVGRLQ